VKSEMPHADVSVVVGTVVRTRYFPQIPYFKTPAFLLAVSLSVSSEFSLKNAKLLKNLFHCLCC